MNPTRLAISLIISLLLGALFLLISVPRYYGAMFSLENTALLSASQLPVLGLSLNTVHPLLIGMLLGCSVGAALFNLLRFVFTRYRGNLLFSIALSFLLLFIFFLANNHAPDLCLNIKLSSDLNYLPALLAILFFHALCLNCIPRTPAFKKLTKQLIRHMGLLGFSGIALLVLAPAYAHILSYFLLISSTVLLLGGTLMLWQHGYAPARTFFIGLSICFLPLIAVWPALINEAFLSADIAIICVLISLPLSATILSIGLSQNHRYQIAKNSSALQQHTAEQAEKRAKSELLAKISHEIRTPLSGVLGMTTLLLDTPLSSKQRDYAQTIQSAGNELLGLINEILDISRLESNDIVLNHTQFNPAGLLQECTQAFYSSAHEQQVELTVFLQPQVPETLLGDPARLRQVLFSILKNAFQRTHNGEIILSAAVEQDEDQALFVLTVQDTGTPLSDAERHILSTAQLHSKDLLSASFIGGNLGIIIARQLVSLMQGSLSIQRSAQGTLFTVSIALKSQHRPAAHVEPDLALRQKHILIIDSNALSQKVLAQQCSAWGMLVSTRSSPADAIAFLRNKALQGQRFATILISDTTHKASAIPFAVRIQEDPLLAAGCTLIMLTSSSHIDSIAARNAGISHVLIKPVSSSTLKTTLINAVQHSMNHNHVAHSMSAKRVLVAEDDAISVKVISGLLNKLGVSVDVAANGQIALDKLEQQHYDWVLMDCEMPVMDGFTAAQKRREYEAAHDLPAVPIIALSAHVLEEHQLRAKQSGMNGHLAKPIELAKLQAILSNHVNN
ncbi:response regulator [Pseudomonas sp. C27(2019)]|uniref:response regulator n=1 Tax=Pseudomonas sp. C27(2019) TaxID=2604941 RepID=UPI001243BB48|nr:response regulator [Pseudomonas sp. C27(2019)]QEY59545.1 response regulator [Pseudomonas sp. C27(2019)]